MYVLAASPRVMAAFYVVAPLSRHRYVRGRLPRRPPLGVYTQD